MGFSLLFEKFKFAVSEEGAAVSLCSLLSANFQNGSPLLLPLLLPLASALAPVATSASLLSAQTMLCSDAQDSRKLQSTRRLA